MGLNPFDRAVFAFCNRRRDRVKVLFFDRGGFVMILKRLADDKFQWPRRPEAVLNLSAEQLQWLLDGSDIDGVQRRQERFPERQYQYAS